MQTKSAGFTVIEVMLFLGISGMLLISIFAFSGTLIADTRFTDSVRGFESFLQRQYEEVVSGVNSRGDTPCNNASVSGTISSPGTTNCLLLGKLVVMRANSNQVEVYTVVGRGTPTTTLTNPTLEQAFATYTPRTIPSSKQTYNIPWDTYFRAGRRGTNPASPSNNAALILRSPASSQIAIYHASIAANGVSQIALASSITAAGSNTTADYCVAGREGAVGRYQAAITFSRSQGSSAISSNFDFSSGAPC